MKIKTVSIPLLATPREEHTTEDVRVLELATYNQSRCNIESTLRSYLYHGYNTFRSIAPIEANDFGTVDRQRLCEFAANNTEEMNNLADSSRIIPIMRPMRTHVSDSVHQVSSQYTQDHLHGIMMSSQSLSIQYPVRQGNRGIRYRRFTTGDSSFIDTHEENIASSYLPSRLQSDWRPNFKKCLSGFFIAHEKKHMQEALITSLLDPTRYNRKISTVCEAMVTSAGQAIVTAVNKGFFPKVDFVCQPNSSRNSILLSNLDTLQHTLSNKEIDHQTIPSWIYKVPYCKHIARDTRQIIDRPPKPDSGYRSSDEAEMFSRRMLAMGSILPRPFFPIVILPTGIFGAALPSMERLVKEYASNDVSFLHDSKEAKKQAKCSHCVGFICPDTRYFNYADNVYMMALIGSIIESAVMLRETKVVGCETNNTVNNIDKIKQEMNIIYKLRIGKKFLPGYLRHIYDKCRSLEYKWHKKRMEISEWRSPYYYERGYAG